MESTASKVTMIQGAGGQVPGAFKRMGAHKVSGYHSRDRHPMAQATNYSVWEMEIEGCIKLPFLDWFDDVKWQQLGETASASETEVYAVGGRFFFCTGQEIAQEELLSVLCGQAYLRWETFTRTDGTGQFVVVKERSYHSYKDYIRAEEEV